MYKFVGRYNYLVLLAGVVVLTAVVYVAHGRWAPQNSDSGASYSVRSAGLTHIFVIVEENKPASSILGNPEAPFLNALAAQSAVASNYSAVTNPSLPNYIALTSGSTQGLRSDCNPPDAGCIVDAPNLPDRLEQSGRTWKMYAEDMPSPCYTQNVGQYATKHNPFIYYADIVNNSARCQSHVVPFSDLTNDLRAAETTPNFAFISPNLCNDMHDCSVATGDAWLADNVPTILNSPAFVKQPSLLVITWDEGESGDNKIVTIMVGNKASRGYTSKTSYTHYSLLRTIEDAWGLVPFTRNDQSASAMSDMINSEN